MRPSVTKILSVLSVCLVLIPTTKASEQLTLADALHLVVFDTRAPISFEQEIGFAALLAKETQAYLQEVQAVGPHSFRNRTDVSAETAAALVQEARNVEFALKTMLDVLDAISKRSKDDENPLAWIVVARQISLTIAEMDDLSRWGLVESDWNIPLREFLNGIFDKLIIPRVAGPIK